MCIRDRARAAAGATAKVNDDCKDGAWTDQLLIMPDVVDGCRGGNNAGRRWLSTDH